MTFFAFSALVNALISFFLGSLVYARGKNFLNKSFSQLNFVIAFWSFGYVLWQLSTSQYLALALLKAMMIFGLLVAPFDYLFTIYFLGIEKKQKISIYFTYIASALFALIDIFSNGIVNGVDKKMEFKFWPNAGPLLSVYLVIFAFWLLNSLYFLIREYKRTKSGIKKEQLRYILIGSLLGYAGGSTNFFLWYNIQIPPYGNIFISLLIMMMFYAVFTHHIIDIKVAARRYSVYLFSLLTIILPALIVKIFLSSHFQNSTVLNITILILGVSFFPAVKDFFYKLSNKYFFSSLYNPKQVIAELGENLNMFLEADKIYYFISDLIMNSFHSKAIAVLLYDNDKETYFHIKYNNGFDPDNLIKINIEKNIKNEFLENKIIYFEELRHNHYAEFKEFIRSVTDLEMAAFVPINLKNKRLGLIVLGPKESGDIYNEDDADVLKIMSSQTSIALENAFLYEETEMFNVKLKKEIDMAVADLKKANAKLKELDEAKSEFISIASHQLRTPLTAIKGYVSMMLEGDFGRLEQKKEESLKKVFDSNQRLIGLIEDLLDVSRIESGKMEYNFKEARLNGMVLSVIDELANYAKNKNLNLEFEKPNEGLPEIRMDEEKIRLVIMNLIDNAIKYTQKGFVRVSLKVNNPPSLTKGGTVEFCVSDSGMGVRPEDLPNLFQKFTRGTGTSLVHTEGTGLGLYVARQMIEAHHGHIWAESDGEGKGSRFCFSLPIKYTVKVQK